MRLAKSTRGRVNDWTYGREGVEDLKIEVLDSIMGSGKTQGIIQWMLDNPNYKYLYVSPLLAELDNTEDRS